MPEPQPFDVRKAIEQSSTRSTLQDLAKRGIHRVKVLDETMINKLIGDAVERIVSTKTNLLSDSDRAKLIEASRHELDRLMAEHQSMKDKTELMERDKNSLVQEVENLQKQLQATRKLADDTARQRYEDGKNIMRAEVDDMKAKLASAEERVRREVALEFQAKMATQATDVEKARSEAAATEGRVRHQMELEFQSKMSTQAANMEQLKSEAAATEGRVRRQMELEYQAKLANQMAGVEQVKAEAAQKQAAMIEEMKKSDDDLFRKMAELFTKSIDSLSKKLTDLRLRALAGGGSFGAGGMGGEVELHPSQATMESLFSQELESNLKAMHVEGKAGGRLGGALDRLKALRGGGPAPKTEEKKSE